MTSSRAQLAQRLLPKHSIDSFIITNLTNIHYVSGIQASAGLLLITKKKIVLFIDSRYSEMASKRALKGILIADPSQIQKHFIGIKCIGFESDDVTVARLERWKKVYKNKKFVQTTGLIEGLRLIKDVSEMQCINTACSITKKALSRVSALLRIGMTEKQLALELYVYCMKKGADGMAFDTIVAFGENTSKPHHKPSNTMLKKGDIVQVDMGARFSSYCSDYSRVYFTVPATTEQKKAYRALKEAKKSAERLLLPGVLNTELDKEARRILKLYGYEKEFSHSLGHGVGLDIHEGTTISMKAAPTRLLKNEVVTIEPGLYFPGKFGMRLEDTRVVGSPDF